MAALHAASRWLMNRHETESGPLGTGRIKLMVDYDCHPLWDLDDPGNIDPETLPLSAGTRAALRAWAEAYDATLDCEDPPASGFASLGQAVEHHREGARLRERLRAELGQAVEVVYWSPEPSELVRRPSEGREP